MSGASIMRKIHLSLFFFVLLYSACTRVTDDDLSIDLTIVDHYNKLASAYLLSHPDSVLYYTELALQSSNIINGHELDRFSYYMQGHAYRMKGDLQKAHEMMIKAESLSLTAKHDSLDAEIFLLLGNIYTELGQYDVALEHYHEAVTAFEMNGIDVGQGKSLNNIALIYYRIDDIASAEAYNKLALDIWGKTYYPRGMASSLTIQAYILTARQIYDSAVVYHRRAQSLYRENGYDHLYANSFLNIGDVYLKMGAYEQAYEAFLQSLSLSHDKTYLQIYVDGLNKLGQSLTRLGRFEEAADTLFSGLKMAKEINDQAMLAEFYNHIAQLYFTRGDFENAYEYQREYESYKDVIFMQERALRIAEFEVLYQTEQMEELNRELEVQNQRRLLYIYFSSAFIALFLVLITVIYSRYRIRIKYLRQQKELNEQLIQQQKLAMELEKNKNERLLAEGKLKEEENAKLQMEVIHRHNELSSVTMHIYQKNESLNKLLMEVERIEKIAREEVREELRKLKMSIQQDLHLDDDWDRFKLHFNQVHQGFIDRLTKEFDSLTNLDLRHCSYIRMNLSTKEISRLLNISPSSVQKSRVRLKKKLSLGPEEDLYDFVLKY